MKRIVTGSTHIEPSEIDRQLAMTLKNDTVESCTEFSNLYYQLFSKWNGGIAQSREILKEKAQEIKNFEENNSLNLYKYLEHLILDNNNYEFMIPYYLISKDIEEDIHNRVADHENHYFGALGNIHDFWG